MAKISIIIPVYNVPRKFLIKCINSVIKQTYKDIEIVIVDDGSGDECSALCDEFKGKDNRINVVHKKNGGLSDARNAGVQNTNSDWFMFLDGDDWIEEDVCEKISELIKYNTDVIVFGMYRDQNNNVSRIPMKYYRDKEYLNEECESLRKMTLKHDYFLSSSVAKLYNMEFIKNNNLWHDTELKCGMEGIEFIYRVFCTTNNVKISNYYGYHYVYNEDSLSAIPTIENNYLTMKGIEKIKQTANKLQLDDIALINQRHVYSIMAIATRSYFNPRQKSTYFKKRKEYIRFIRENYLKELIKNIKYSEYPKKKIILLFLIKHNLYFLINIYSYVSAYRFIR